MQGKHFRTFFKTWRVRLGLYKRCCFDSTTYNLFTKNYPSKLIPCTYSFHFSLILAPLCILSKKAQSISVLSFMSKFLAIRASSGHWIAHPTIIFYDKMFLAFHRSVWGNPPIYANNGKPLVLTWWTLTQCVSQKNSWLHSMFWSICAYRPKIPRF